MFESKKYEKMKASGEFSEIRVYVPENADKAKLKSLLKLLKADFGNYKVVKGEKLSTIYAVGEDLNIEMKLGEIMEVICELKTGETIKFSVNDTDYEI